VFPGLRFETRAPAAPTSAARADVVCFVGYARVRPEAEAFARAQYEQLGWRGKFPTSFEGASLPPLVVESALAFDAVFDGWVRARGGRRWEGALSGAVHDFFRQGGRRAWIVPVGEPFVDEDEDGEPHPPPVSTIHARLEALIPGANGGADVSPADRGSWRGLAHLHGLPEVALVCLPDLPGLVGAPQTPSPPLPALPVGEPRFVECSLPSPEPPEVRSVGAPGVPRLGPVELARWQVAVAHAVGFVKTHRPDVHLVLSLPLWTSGSEAETAPLPDLLQLGRETGSEPARSHSRLWRHGAGREAAVWSSDGGRRVPPTLLTAEGKAPNELPGIGSAFLQLAYPWFSGDSTLDRPDRIGAPDGLVAGILARTTLSRGAFRTAAGERAEGVAYLEPELTPRAMHRAEPPEEGTEPLALVHRVALLQRGSGGVRLGSDPATTANPRWRQAGLNRLYGVILRLLRGVGETLVFEPSNAATWDTLRSKVESVLKGLVEVGALSGPQPFRVRCDHTTMSQQDIDAGRMVAVIEVSPAPAIERVTVVLTVADASSAEIGGAVP